MTSTKHHQYLVQQIYEDTLHEYNPFLPENCLILRKSRVAVMHSPKCGSLKIVSWWLAQMGSLECAMRFTTWPHDFENMLRNSAEYIKDALGFDPRKYKSYKIVRNPITRTVSSFLLGDPAGFG